MLGKIGIGDTFSTAGGDMNDKGRKQELRTLQCFSIRW